MYVALIAEDKPGALEIRLANREAHLAYLDETKKVVFGGPMLDEEGNMCGSMAVLEVDSLDEAREWAANDPYAKAGLFEKVTLRPWKRVIG